MASRDVPLVVHLVHSLDVGGTERALVSLLRAFDHRTMRHAVVTLRDAGSLAAQLPEEVACVALDAVGRARTSGFRLAKLFAHLSPSLVHARNVCTWPDAVMARMLTPGAKPVLGFHGLQAGGRFSRRDRWTAHIARALGAHFTSVSEQGRRQMSQQLCVPLQRIEHLPNGIDVRRFDVDTTLSRQGVRESLGILPTDWVVGIVGSLTAVKGHDVLLSAVAVTRQTMRTVRLLVVGGGPLRVPLEAAARELGLHDCVRFTGWSDEVPTLLRAMDAYVCASRSEGMSNAVMEAMAAGLPVVSTAVGDHPAIIRHRVDGVLVPPDDPAALAGAFRTLSTAPEHAAKMGRSARAHRGFQFRTYGERISKLLSCDHGSPHQTQACNRILLSRNVKKCHRPVLSSRQRELTVRITAHLCRIERATESRIGAFVGVEALQWQKGDSVVMSKKFLRAFCGVSLCCVMLAGGCRNHGGATKTTAGNAGESRAARHTAASKSANTELIPRETLFGNPDRASPQISPDGTRLAYLAPVNGVLNVWVGPVDRPDQAKPVTNDTSRGIRRYFWAFTNQHIIYMQDKGGDENWRVYSVDLARGDTKDLTPFDKVAAQVEAVSHRIPDEIIVGLNNRNPQYHDLHRVNIRTGQMDLLAENNEYAGYVTDDDYKVPFAMKMTPDGGSEIFKSNAQGTWETFIKIGMEDSMTTSPLGLDKTGKTLFMLDSRGRNTAALAALNIADGAAKILGENKQADVSGALTHPTENNIQAFSANYERVKWTVVDPSIKSDFEYLGGVAEGDFNVGSRTLDDSKWIVSYMMDNGPVRFYLYDRPSKKATFLFTNNERLADVQLAKMNPVIIKSRDGMNLVSYLTLPAIEGNARKPRPGKPLPLVLFVHGGPWARDQWGLNSSHQWLANRGYAVLSVNYRGSTGFGKGFINASNMEWAGKMHDDLIDAVNWSVKEKIADPQRVAIMGGSYGGYATLVGLTFTPDVFACGVDIVGPSNLVTLLNTIPPYWTPMIETFTKRVGDHRTDEGKSLLNQRSPLNFVDRIEKPLLIGQGANDPRVKQSESDQIVKAMKDKNIPVTYVLFPDEGHGFARPENRMSFNAVAEAFLAQHLGGRFEPVGDDFKGASISVPTGADQVPGLTTALPATH